MMDIFRAKEIMKCLADGVNPLTGEVLPPEDSCNQPEVIRAFHVILSVLPEKPRKSQPENAGKPWTSEDERVLAIRHIPHIRDTVPGASGNDLVRRHLSASSDGVGHGFIRFHPVGIRRLEIVSSAYGIVL